MSIGAAKKLSAVLKWVITVMIAGLILLLVFVPALSKMRALTLGAATEEASVSWSIKEIFTAWGVLFGETGIWPAVLAWFMLFCGACGSAILWQARITLRNLAEGRPFDRSSPKAMVRAAICCFLIAAASAARLIWSIAWSDSWAPLATYTAFFIPVFVLAGLLCLVAASLFGGAADLKEDSELCI